MLHGVDLTARPGRDHRDDRQHRQRQDHAAQPGAAAVRRHRRRRCWSTAWTCRELDPALLSRTVGLVPQRPYLFTGTVASNLRYGNPDATDEELWRALEIAQARDFVERMEAAWTRRSPRAAPTSRVVSGSGWRSPGCWCAGRRSTCSTTRSRRSTTPPTRRCGRAGRHIADATVVIVAQRVSTIRDADRIVVLDDGRVVGTGTHAELMDTNRRTARSFSPSSPSRRRRMTGRRRPHGRTRPTAGGGLRRRGARAG